MAMPAMPAKPVHSAGRASLSGNGPNVTASRKNASRHSTLATSRTCRAGSPRARSAAPSRRAAAITITNSGNARSFATTPCVPDTSVAANVTKLPVTCAVNNPCSPRNPAVSTKPPLKLSKAEMADGLPITTLPPFRLCESGSGFLRADRDEDETGDQAEVLKEGIERHEPVLPGHRPEVIGDQHGDGCQDAEAARAEPDQPPGHDQQRSADLEHDRERGP